MAIFYRKSNAQPSLFFNQRTDGFLRRLRSKKDLEEYLGIDEVFDFESFRPQIEAAVAMQVKPKKSKRGRPSFDPVFMAKALWLMHRLGQPMTTIMTPRSRATAFTCRHGSSLTIWK